MRMRRVWLWIGAGLAGLLAISLLLVFNPALQRKFYYERIVRAVPLGSTKAQFDEAVLHDIRLAQEIIVREDGKTVIYATRHPIQNGMVEMFVCVEPELGTDGKITGYQVWSGYHFPIYNENTPYFVYPQPH